MAEWLLSGFVFLLCGRAFQTNCGVDVALYNGSKMANVELDCVLLLEDEPFIAMDLELTLRDAGASTIVTFMTRAQAEVWLEANSTDVAILDPNLKDGSCSSVAKTLADRSVPFIVYSGDRTSIQENGAFKAGMWLPKPCLPEEVTDAMVKVWRDRKRY